MPCLLLKVKKYIDGRLYTRAKSSLGNLPSYLIDKLVSGRDRQT